MTDDRNIVKKEWPMTNPTIPIGDLFAGRYKVIDIVTSGGLTTMYRALDERLDRFVAIKVLGSTDPAIARRFVMEGQLQAQLRHPNIVAVIEVDASHDRPYLAMEFVDGSSLEEVLTRSAPVDVEYAVSVIRQISNALTYLHAIGLVHRDIKPSNILISNSGRVCLADFGLANFAGDDLLTSSGMVLGTPTYMAPEQVVGKPLDSRTDVYALGVTLYRMLTGKLPFDGPTSAHVFRSIVDQAPLPPRRINPSIPVMLEQIILKCIQKTPDRRFQTAEALSEALDDLSPNSRIKPFRWVTRPSRPTIARPQYVGLIVFFLGVIVVLVIFNQYSDNRILVPGLDQITPIVVLAAILGAAIIIVLMWRRRSLNYGDMPEFNATMAASMSPGPPNERRSVIVEPDIPVSATDSRERTSATHRFEPTRTIVLRQQIPVTAWLVVLNGPLRGRQFELHESISIGRDATSGDIALADSAVSRSHAKVRLENGTFYLCDLASRNGSYVNDMRVTTRQQLDDGDEIRVGNTTFIFKQIANPEDMTTDARRRLREFDDLWKQLSQAASAMADRPRYISLSSELAHGLLRESLCYRIEGSIQIHKHILGFMVNAPTLWIRRTRFPILFIAYGRNRTDVLSDVVVQMQNAQANEFFALLVVVPTQSETGNEADELRHLVNNSVYRHDFVVLDHKHLESLCIYNNPQRLIEIMLKQGIDLATLSPYVTKGPVSDNMFFGRAEEIKQITQGIQTQNFAIVGGRRIGKSSVLQKVLRLLENDSRYKTKYLNCEDIIDYETFFRRLKDEFAHFSLGQTHEPQEFRHIAGQFQEAVKPRRIVFGIDEVDDLLAFDRTAQPAYGLFKVFRTLAHEGVCRFIFTGSKTLHQSHHDASSPFFNFSEEIVLGPLAERSVGEMLTKPMQQLGIKLLDPDRLVDRLIAYSGCHANLVQFLCKRLVETTETRQVDIAHLERIRSEYDYANLVCENAWQNTNALERLVAAMMETPVFTEADVRKKLAEVGFTDRAAVKEALDILQLIAFVRRDGDRFRLTLPEFPDILRGIEDVPELIESLTSQLEV